MLHCWVGENAGISAERLSYPSPSNVKKMFTCFWSTMMDSTVAVMPFFVWLWPTGWT